MLRGADMAYVEKTKGGLWRGRYRDSENKLHAVPAVKSKREALRLAHEQEAKLFKGTWVDPAAGRITLSEYWENQWFPSRHVELNSKKSYQASYVAKGGIRDRFGKRPLASIRHSDVQGWVDAMVHSGVHPRTLQLRFTHLQLCLAGRRGTSAMRDRLIEANPCAAVQLPVVVPPTVDVYAPNELEAVVMAMDEWWRPIPALAGDTGMRWGELMGLTVDDFSLNYRSVRVRRTILEVKKCETDNGTPFMWKMYPKGRKERPVALLEETQTVVRNLVAERGLKAGDRLFSMQDRDGGVRRSEAWPEGVPISRAYYRTCIWKPATEAAGVRYLKPHSTRGAHISWLLAGGADLPTVMARVGHSQFSTTKRYTATMEDADRRGLDALSATKRMYLG